MIEEPGSPERAPGALWFARSVAIATVLVAGTVLFGWATGRTALTTLGTHISMKPNTALAFLLLCGALWRRASRVDRPRDRIARALAAAASTLGALTLLEHVTGLDLRIDQMLFTEPPGMPATAAPGRMGPPASLSFLLLGTALLVMRARGRAARIVLQVAALASACIALLPLVGYFYGTTELYTVARLTGIAPATAALLEALAIAVLFIAPETSFVAAVADTGVAGQLARRTLVYSTVLPLASGWLIAQGLQLRLYDGGFAISILVLVLILTVTLLVGRDAAHIGRAERARHESESRFTTLFETMTEGFAFDEIICDEAGRPRDLRYLQVNPAFERHTGLKATDILGRTVLELFPDAEAFWFERYGKVALTGEPAHFQAQFGPLGRWFEVSAYQTEPGRFATVFFDITARKRAEDALKESEQRASTRAAELQALLDAVPAAVFIARDPEAKEIEGNRFGVALLRLGQGANVSRSPADERPGYRVMRGGKEVPPEELPARLAAARGIEVRDWECEIVFDAAPSIHLLGCAAPLRDEGGQPWGSVSAFVDITQRVRAEEELREAGRRKDEFLAVLSHELRNPLAPIQNSVYLLGRPGIAPEQIRRGLAVIERQVSHLSRLVEDLLDVSRISRGKVQLQRTTIDLAEVVRRASEDHRMAAIAAGLELAVDVPDQPLWIEGDATRLAQIAGNLVSNAVKFTPSGGRVTVSARRDGPEGVELRVRDTGVGIDAAMRARLFEPFAQADSTLERSRGGLGLGLTLVKSLVDLHEGRIEARSDGAGRGAEFVVHFPLGRAPASASADEANPALVAPLRILLIEDNVDAAVTLREALQLAGYEVEIAHDGEDGLARARRSRPDVVLCDIGLPNIDGYEVARALRAGDETHRPLLIAITGYASPEDTRRAADAGFDHHFAKPANLAKLLAILARSSTAPGA